MTVLEEQSDRLGVSGKSLDTRVLMPDYDKKERVRLALDMFAYRALTAVVASVAALGGADAVTFGRGIAQNTAFIPILTAAAS
jgi:acetate kinase